MSTWDSQRTHQSVVPVDPDPEHDVPNAYAEAWDRIKEEDHIMPFRSRSVPAGAVQPKKTVGLSPKAVLAFVFPTVASVAAVGSSWVATGSLDTTSLRTAAVGLIAASIAALGAYVGQVGTVELTGTAEAPKP